MTQPSFATHEVLNQSPPFEDVDLFALDRPLLDAVASNGGAAAEKELSEFGQHWGSAAMAERGRLANENTPKLRTFDSKGNRRDQVEFHPAYHELMARSAHAGLHNSTWTADGRPAGGAAEVVRAAKFYMAAGVETGHLCPITMTRASVAALSVQPDLLAKAMPVIATRAYDPTFAPWPTKRGMTLGMGMTEKQGGTDVRTNTTRAERCGDAYRITGHKWFMSAPMCDAFLVLAQADAGLTCFFMPRFEPDGSVNAIQFQRLKEKLGNRSNASSEVEFKGAYGERVGDEGKGIRTIIQMVQLTRQDCAIASAGLMRSGLAHALHHARHRSVFQKHLADQPLMEAVLSDMALHVEASIALVMRLCRAFDRAPHDPGRGGLYAAVDAGDQILGLQERAGISLRGDGVPWRQRLCRGGHFGAALPRNRPSMRSGKARATSCASMCCAHCRVRPMRLRASCKISPRKPRACLALPMRWPSSERHSAGRTPSASHGWRWRGWRYWLPRLRSTRSRHVMPNCSGLPGLPGITPACMAPSIFRATTSGLCWSGRYRDSALCNPSVMPGHDECPVKSGMTQLMKVS